MKLTTLSVAMIAMMATASSYANNTAVEDKAVNNLKATISSSSAEISSFEVKLDAGASNFVEKNGDQLVPVVVGGRRFLTNKDGDTLFNPAQTYVIGETGVTVAGHILEDYDFKATKDKWPSLPLPDGVDKKGDVFVVTDPTCSFCRAFEKDVPTYLASGIEVHYIPYPRSGPVSGYPAFDKWSQASCSDEPGVAIHNITLGRGSMYKKPEQTKDKKDAPCTDIIVEGYSFGSMIGVTGTPYIYAVSNEGEIFRNSGYMPVNDLIPSLGLAVSPIKADIPERP